MELQICLGFSRWRLDLPDLWVPTLDQQSLQQQRRMLLTYSIVRDTASNLVVFYAH